LRRSKQGNIDKRANSRAFSVRIFEAGKNFRHKGQKKLYDTGSQQGVKSEHANRLRLILARLDASQSSQDMGLPGLNLHTLKGKYKGFWAVSLSGNWRVIFRFEDNSVVDIDYLDYH
jgi:proteic killer suppression protein